MARSVKSPIADLVHRWRRDACALNEQARGRTGVERRLIEMHARVKDACAGELERTLPVEATRD